MMDQTRFSALLSAYGADPKRWPQAERPGALAFMENNGETATRLMAETGELDGLLEAARAEPPSAELAGRILAAGQAQARFAPEWARLAAVLALSAGLGLGWGGASLGGASQSDAAYAMAFSSFADPAYEELVDFIDGEGR
ncbi:hypothetical protein X907_2049 [Glycocaulis alkaliphilus]|uniref:Uncharacterized protein n=1 Tax=Glycocaulis alkaliphilus TaxID=1434191 RepID=A0A3T0EB86_9PROT|nr:hypothetical protein [Glycocaulis alkaliphilus]AZU04572.1 hypothetical protein X907_2049 [Glycocaulis alkaliphilus]